MNSQSTPFNYEAALLACSQGQRKALRALYDQESARLLAVVLRVLQNRSLAEDIVHDAFIKIWTNAHSFNPELGSARGWIYTLTRNLALNAIRYSDRQVNVDQDLLTDIMDEQRLSESESSVSLTHDGLSDSTDATNLHRCLDTLEPERKTCILYAYVEGYTQDEIAQQLKKPLGTVKSWIKRSLHMLKECMQ